MRGWWVPTRLCFGAVFQKDVSVSGRGWAVYLLRALFALTLTLVVALVFIGAWDEVSSSGSTTGRLQTLQDIAPTIFRFVVGVLFGAVVLISPALAGGAICDEKRAMTLSSLLTTPLTPLEIVCSKISSRLVQIVILGLLTLPAILSVRLFGGVRADSVLVAVALTLVGALMGLSLGVLVSTRMKRPATAALGAYFLLAALFFLPTIACVVFNEYMSEYHPGATFADILGPWAPDTAVKVPEWFAIALSLPAAFGATLLGAGTGLPGDIWAWSAGVGLVYSALFTLAAAASLRGVMRREAGAARVRKRKTGKDGAPAIVVGRSRSVSDHPVAWRELRQPIFDSKITRIVGLVAGLALFGWIIWATEDPHVTPLMMVPGLIASMCILMQGAMLTSASLASERESRTLDTLLSTRLTAGEIVWGKFIGTLRRQWLVPFVALVFYGWLWLMGVFHPMFFVHAALIFVGPLIMLAGTSVLFGQVFRRGMTASIANAALACALWLILPIAGAFVFAALESFIGPPPEALGDAVVIAHPVVTSGVTLDAFHTRVGGDLSYFSVDVDLPTGNVTAPAFLMLQLIPALLYSLVGAGALWLARARFGKHTGRVA